MFASLIYIGIDYKWDKSCAKICLAAVGMILAFANGGIITYYGGQANEAVGADLDDTKWRAVVITLSWFQVVFWVSCFTVFPP